MKISRLHYISQDIPGKSHTMLISEACKGGIKWVQLRVKDKSHDDLLQIAKEAKSICRKYNATLIINDNVSVAREVGADGVHIGKTDMNPAAARELLGPDVIIGATANSWEDVENLKSASIDYIGVGPYRFTSTKVKLSPVLGIEGIRDIVQKSRKYEMKIPFIAIGGIEIKDISDIANAGIYGIAVAGAINIKENPAGEAASFMQAIENSYNHNKIY